MQRSRECWKTAISNLLRIREDDRYLLYLSECAPLTGALAAPFHEMSPLVPGGHQCGFTVVCMEVSKALTRSCKERTAPGWLTCVPTVSSLILC